jgi:hypothetical protein
MMPAASASIFRVLRMRPVGVFAFALDQRHHRNARLEAAQPQRQFREQDRRDQEHRGPVAVRGVGEHGVAPLGDQVGMPQDVQQAGAEHHQVQQQEGNDDRHGQVDRFAEADEKHGGQNQQQQRGEPELRVAEIGMEQGIGHRVAGRVGGR